MPFGKTYKEIEELMLKTALDTQMCRDIVRRSGLQSGGSVSGLLQQLLTPSAPDSRPRRPRRRVQNGLFWPYDGYAETPDGDTYWDKQYSFGDVLDLDTTLHSDSTVSTVDGEVDNIGRLADSQLRWHGMHLPGFSDHRLPVGAHLAPHAPSAGAIRTGRAWVGGQSEYDPFPYPGYYLWADTKEAYVHPFIGQIFGGNGASPYDTSGGLIPPAVFKCLASSDGGSTWGAPWPPVTTSSGVNPGSAYFAYQVGPGYSPGPLDDGFVQPNPNTLKDEYRKDDTLFKITLTMNSANWLQFHTVGLYVVGYRPESA